jgi:hypothetical protein
MGEARSCVGSYGRHVCSCSGLRPPPEFLAEVAAEHRKGRRLLIGTTNLDAERPVIWDIGAIASSVSLEAFDLFRTVLLSSAAITAVEQAL